MATLKVLECPKYAKYIGTIPGEIEYFAAKETRPIFHRNGWYFNRLDKISWIEYNDKAYFEDVSMFKYTLSLLDHIPLTDDDIKAINLLSNNKIIKMKKFIGMLIMDKDWKDLRSIHREKYTWKNKLKK